MPSKEHETPRRRERNWYTQKGGESANDKSKGPVCIYCKGDHWGDQCTSYESMSKRRQFFVENRLCFNWGRAEHRESTCRSRGCFKCKGKHHTSICDKPQGKNNGVGMGTILIASIDTVDTCELGVSIDTSTKYR